MTREEAIEIIRNYDVNGCGYCHQGGDEVEEAIDMAIKALEQEPCEDCISRKQALNAIGCEIVGVTNEGRELLDLCQFAIKQLPSIQPKTDVLDKISAEIEFIPTIEWKDDDTTYILASYFKKQVLEIIDKYKAEKE